MFRFLMLVSFLISLSLPALAGFEEGRKAYDAKDWTAAITELRPLAQAGDDRAMVLLGNMYAEGNGVAQDYKEAISLFTQAADQKNNLEAMVFIASMHVAGLGVEKSFDAALPYAKRAAEGGNQAGAFLYANLLAEGSKPDFYNVYKWYRLSLQSDAYPQFHKTAQDLSRRIAAEKLKSDEKTRADLEVSSWKPITPQKP